MPEAPSSSEQHGTLSVAERTRLAIAGEALAKDMSHTVAADIRNLLDPLKRGILLLRQLDVPSRIIDLFARNVQCLDELAEDILNNPLTEHTAEEFHAVLQTLLEKLRPKFADLEIVLEPLPEDLRASAVLASQSLWMNVLEKLLANAAEKERHAKHVVVSLSGDLLNGEKFPAVGVSVRDDGDGMRPAILDAVRRQDRVSDKRAQLGKEHGLGLITVGFLVEGRSKGKMYVDSVHADDDAVNHGTHFLFKLPDLTALKRVNRPAEAAPADPLPAMAALVVAPSEVCTRAGESPESSSVEPVTVPAQPRAPLEERRRLSRRQVLELLAGGGLAASIAAAFGIPALMRRRSGEEARAPQSEAAPEQPKPVISDLRFDQRGRIVSFTVAALHEPVTYELGRQEDRRFQEYPLPEGWVVAFDLQQRGAAHDLQYLCSVPGGIFGVLKAGRGRGYVSVPGPMQGRTLAVEERQVFSQKDVAFAAGFRATSAAYLERPDLPMLRRALERLSDAQPKQQQKRDGPSFARVAGEMRHLLRVHQQFQGRSVTVDDRDELRRRLAAPGSFIMVSERLSAVLQTELPTPEEKELARKRNYDLCLRNMYPDQASSILRG